MKDTCDCERIDDFGVRGILCPATFDDEDADRVVWVARHDACGVYESDIDAAHVVADTLGCEVGVSRNGRPYLIGVSKKSAIHAMRRLRSQEGLDGVERVYGVELSWSTSMDIAPTTDAALFAMADQLGALLRDSVSNNDIETIHSIIDRMTEAPIDGHPERVIYGPIPRRPRSTSIEAILARLRAAGLRVAVHNDYRQGGEDFSFWLMTLPQDPHGASIAFRGEGRTDEEALLEIERQAIRRRVVGYRTPP